MSHDNVKLGALLLSALMQCSDEELAKFRKRRLRNEELDLMHLLRAREVLTELYAAIANDDEATRRRVHDAWKALRGTTEDDARRIDEEGVVRMPAVPSGEPPPAQPDLEPSPPAVEPRGPEPPAWPPKPVSPPEPILHDMSRGASPWAVSSGMAEAPIVGTFPPQPARDATLPFHGEAPAPPPIGGLRKRTGTIGVGPQQEGITLPFVTDGAPEMTVASYAAFCAVTEEVPAAAKIVAAAYGLSGDVACAELHGGWRRRFDEDPASQQLWQLLREQFRGWMRVHGPR